MANQEHLDILKQGVEAWNQWRKKHIDIQPNLSGADLSGAVLWRVNLSRANLRGASFRQASLSEADLSGADLSEASFSLAYLGGADLSEADLSGAKLIGTDLRQAKLRDAKLSSANLSRADLSEADLSGTSLSRADVSGVNLSNADLSEADRSDAIITSEQLTEASVKPGGIVIYTYRGHYSCVNAVAWSPDGQHIASGSDDDTVQVWNAADGGHVFTYRGHADRVNVVVWSPDGQRIASRSEDDTVRVWDAAKGGRALAYYGYAKAVAWSPDGQRIASESYGHSVEVCDAVDGGHVFTYRGHSDCVNAVTWSPDGHRIASGSSDQTVQVWDAADGGYMFTYRGHSDWVSTVVWSPDGQCVASGSGDTTVQVWDGAEGEHMFTYRGHSDWVRTVAWSPDGQRIASGSGDTTVQVWQAPISSPKTQKLNSEPEAFFLKVRKLFQRRPKAALTDKKPEPESALPEVSEPFQELPKAAPTNKKPEPEGVLPEVSEPFQEDPKTVLRGGRARTSFSSCNFPGCHHRSSEYCDTCDGSYCTNHLIKLKSEKSCFRCLQQVTLDRYSSRSNIEEVIEYMNSSEWIGLMNYFGSSEDRASYAGEYVESMGKDSSWSLAHLTSDSVHFIEMMMRTYQELQQTGITEDLRQVGPTVKQRIAEEKAKEQVETRNGRLFLGGVVLVGAGFKLVSALGSWSTVPGSYSIFFGGVGIILGLWMAITAWKRGRKKTDTPSEQIFNLLFRLLLLCIVAYAGLAPAIGIWIAVAGLITSFMWVLWKGMDLLSQIDDVLAGPVGWFWLGVFFGLAGDEAGGAWYGIGIFLCIICWLIGLVWKIVKSADSQSKWRNW